jgi:hypothetical protein
LDEEELLRGDKNHIAVDKAHKLIRKWEATDAAVTVVRSLLICSIFARGLGGLAVKPQEVVPGQTDAADRWPTSEASVGPMPVVAREPGWKRRLPLV